MSAGTHAGCHCSAGGRGWEARAHATRPFPGAPLLGADGSSRVLALHTAGPWPGQAPRPRAGSRPGSVACRPACLAPHHSFLHPRPRRKRPRRPREPHIPCSRSPSLSGRVAWSGAWSVGLLEVGGVWSSENQGSRGTPGAPRWDSADGHSARQPGSQLEGSGAVFPACPPCAPPSPLSLSCVPR